MKLKSVIEIYSEILMKINMLPNYSKEKVQEKFESICR